MIDEALLRPGRLEIHKEIGLPSEEGRRQIFRIHTNKMTVNGYLRGVDLGDLARRTKNFRFSLSEDKNLHYLSGAEIEGIVKNAVSFALSEKVDPENLLKHKDVTNLAIEKQHFDAALKEVTIYIRKMFEPYRQSLLLEFQMQIFLGACRMVLFRLEKHINKVLLFCCSF